MGRPTPRFTARTWVTALCLLAAGAFTWRVVTPYLWYEPGSTGFPSCVRVWQAGHVLPGDARGCTGANGAHSRYHSTYRCRDGTTMIPFTEELWSFHGRVVDGDQEQFDRAVRTCRGSAAPVGDRREAPDVARPVDGVGQVAVPR